MTAPFTPAELEEARALCAGWRGRFVYRPACEHDRGVGHVADFVDYDEALVFVPDDAEDEHDHDECVTICDGLDAEALRALAAMLNLPSGLLGEIERLDLENRQERVLSTRLYTERNAERVELSTRSEAYEAQLAAEAGSLLAILAKARAASPGPWKWWTSNSNRRLTGADGRDGGVLCAIVNFRDGVPDVHCSEVDRARIAACSPDVVIALVDRLQRAESARDAVVTASYEHGKAEYRAALLEGQLRAADRMSVERGVAFDDAQAMLEEVAAERDSAHVDAQESREDVDRHYFARLRADEQIAARDRALDACVERIAGLIAELAEARETLARFAAGHLAPDYLDGALTPATEDKFLKHLSDCSKCEDSLTTEGLMRDLEKQARGKGGE